MRKWGIAFVAAALLLTGCSGGVAGIATKCGGASAGISEDSGVVLYKQSGDTSGDAWTCVIKEAVPDLTDQYRIAQSLEKDGGLRTEQFGSYTVSWGRTQSGIELMVSAS